MVVALTTEEWTEKGGTGQATLRDLSGKERRDVSRMVRTGDHPNVQARRLAVAPQTPSCRAVTRSALVLRKGGLVVFPTDTLYALGADASNPLAVRRVFAAKGRCLKSPVPLLVADLMMATQLIGELPEAAVRLAERFWPGPLTLVLWAPRNICTLLTAGTGRIGLRVPDATVARALVRDFGGPVTGTSANRSGDKDPLNAHEVLQQLGDRVDLVLDGGPVTGGSPSTVVDVTASPPAIVRQGPVQQEEILSLLRLGCTEGKRAGGRHSEVSRKRLESPRKCAKNKAL